MSSSFYGFNVAVSGFFTSQTALDVINHNITNASKEGYSRQVVDMEANMPIPLVGKGMLGAGCSVTDIARVRDEYLDYKYWSENQSGGEWSVKNTSLSEISSLFNEPSDTSINKAIDNFYSALQDLSKNPADSSYRGALREKAITFTKTLNTMAHRLFKEQADVDSEVSAKVEQVNSYASQIAGLNKQIFSLELDGHTANDLRDQRTVLIDNLSKIVNVDVTEATDPVTNMKKMTISVGSTKLVEHGDAKQMVVQKNQKKLDTDGEPLNTDYPFLNSITWADSKANVQIKSGELKGLLDVRDGDGTGDTYRGINFYINRLNEFAEDFSTKFNTLNSKGYTNEDTPVNCGNFFDSSDGTPKIKAYSITISNDIKSDLKYIGASDGVNDVTAKNSDNARNLLNMIDTQNDTLFFTPTAADPTKPQGTPGDFVKAMISSLAVDAQQAKRTDSNQDVMVKQVDTRRKSNSSVDQNEEMSNAIKFQQTFTASAKMINVMDDIYDTIINKLGLVGR